MKKQFCAAVAAAMLLTAGTGALAAEPADAVRTSVSLDGTALSQTALVRDGEAYLPVRAVAEALGYEVTWSGSDGTVTAAGDRGTAVLDLREETAEQDGHTTYLSGRYLLVSERLYLESGLLSDLFGVTAVLEDGAVTVSSAAENAVAVTTMKLASDDENLKVTLQYPQVSGLEDIDVQNAINATLRAAAVSAVDEGLQNAFDVLQTRELYPDYTNKAETYFDYRVTYNQNGLLCVVTTITSTPAAPTAARCRRPGSSTSIRAKRCSCPTC
jgi:inhibitor of cysteine peptidase